ncbi:FHA domain-containing protein [Cryptosporangium sp. NPDC048952]|uniref:FHA domain-containing protein n=1 Tax=Cryptosporangium sp. NPDC048952 TaxID=3363961 RepID=UPI00371D4E91
MGAWLRIDGGSGYYWLKGYERIVIGRNCENEWIAARLTSKKIGKLHVAVTINDSQVLVEDLKSRNGTWVNGRLLVPFKPYWFSLPTEIRLGQTQLLHLELPTFVPPGR